MDGRRLITEDIVRKRCEWWWDNAKENRRKREERKGRKVKIRSPPRRPSSFCWALWVYVWLQERLWLWLTKKMKFEAIVSERNAGERGRW